MRRARKAAALTRLHADMAACRACDRLVVYREAVAREKRRAYADWEYWGRPVPSFGDPNARLLIIGLAPAAHGGNRTGRIFTGDRSGDWLFATLHRFGFANQPTSTHREDGLELSDVYITAAGHCAPPDNKPTDSELIACRPFLLREFALLSRLRVIIALGKIAFDATLAAHVGLGNSLPRPKPRFAHDCAWSLGDLTLIGAYHPSQRNTQTGFLTQEMFDAVFTRARRHMGSED